MNLQKIIRGAAMTMQNSLPERACLNNPLRLRWFSIRRLSVLGALLHVAILGTASAELSAEEAEAMRKAQDPLADVRAIMTDNTIGYESASGQPLYNFQAQPVYSFNKHGFNFIARGMIPFIGNPAGSGPVGLPQQFTGGGGNRLAWGLSDIILQGFIVPETGGSIKYGFGPQVSLRTRTDNAVAGPGWGGGLAACVFSSAGPLSYGGLAAQHWGQDDFTRSSLQPIVLYNTDLFGGSYFGYNNSVVYDWSAGSDEAWLVPAGLTAGKTFILDSGYMVDVSIGAYYLAVAPGGQPDLQFKFGVSLFFP